MPSASLRSRIQAFEALSSSSSKATSATAPTPIPQNRASLPDLLESPISPSASSFHPITPFSALATITRSRSPSPPTPSLTGRTSLIDLKDWIVEDGPVEPQSAPRLTAGIGKPNGIRESSRTPSPSRKPVPGASRSPTPLISFEPPPKPRPPLPPRKPSFGTVDHVSTQQSVPLASETSATLRSPACPNSLAIEHTYPPGAHKFGAGRVGHAPASSISSFHSVSLSSDGNNVETPSPKFSSKPPSFTFEVDSSIVDLDTASIAESFENVSAPSAHSPSMAISFDWDRALGKAKTSPKLEPPHLPHRTSPKIAPIVPPKPLARAVSTSSSSTTTSTKTRRPPPPPYQPRSQPSSSRASVVSTSASTSDRSSILSNATTTSRTSTSTRNSTQFAVGIKPSPLLRPTPVPAAARLRYEALFDSAVKGRRRAEKKKQAKTKRPAPPPLSPSRKGRQATGWRGLSVDLIADSEGLPVKSLAKRVDASDSEGEEVEILVGPEEKLNGRIVRHIWSASRLDRKKLGNIWNDCDPQCTGFIDRDGFVKGMWRIDEELRRAQLVRHTSALTAASSRRIPHRPLLPPRSRATTQLVV